MTHSTPTTADSAGELSHDAIAVSIEDARAHEAAAMRLRASDLVAALEHAREAVAIASRIPDESLRASVNYSAGICLIAAREFSAAREHYEAAARHARNAGDSESAVRSMIGVVHAVILTGALDEAAKILIDLEPEARRLANARFLCAVLNNLGNIFDSLSQPQRAVDCFSRALEHARRHDEFPSLGLALSNLGGILATVGELDRARALLDESIEVYRHMGDTSGEAQASGNLALVLERQGRIGEAIDVHRTVLAHFEADGDLDNVSTSLTQIAGLEQQLGHLDEAVSLLVRALTQINEGSVEGWSIHAQLSRVYEEQGDAARALLHYRQAAEMRQQIDAWINGVALHELQRHVAENEALQDDQVQTIISQRERALDEQDLHGRSVGQTASPSVVLGIQQQAEIVEQLRSTLERLEEPLSKESRHALEALLDDLDSPAKRARALQREVDTANQFFLQRISSRYPTLTPAELRVCSLLRVNLSTKEIAQLLNVGQRNIESHRYSIRRKLALDTSQQLTTWLAAY